MRTLEWHRRRPTVTRYGGLAWHHWQRSQEVIQHITLFCCSKSHKRLVGGQGCSMQTTSDRWERGTWRRLWTWGVGMCLVRHVASAALRLHLAPLQRRGLASLDFSEQPKYVSEGNVRRPPGISTQETLRGKTTTTQESLRTCSCFREDAYGELPRIPPLSRHALVPGRPRPVYSELAKTSFGNKKEVIESVNSGNE